MGNPPRSSLPKSLRGTATGSGFPRPMKQATSQFRCRLGQRCSNQGLPGREASVSGRNDHCCFALPLRRVGGKQQSFWPGSIFRSRLPHEHSVYGQGLNKVRRNRRLGVRSLPRRQTWRSGVYEKLLPLPPEGQRERPCLYSLCTLMVKTGAEKKETMATHKSNRIESCARNDLLKISIALIVVSCKSVEPL